VLSFNYIALSREKRAGICRNFCRVIGHFHQAFKMASYREAVVVGGTNRTASRSPDVGHSLMIT
jgi:hypothetical protein